MLLNKYKKQNSLIKYLIFLFLIGILQYSFASDNRDSYFNKFQLALENLPEPDNSQTTEEFIGIIFKAFAGSLESNDGKTISLLKKWDDYLISITFFQNSDYFSAIESQQKDYLKSIADLNKQIEDASTLKNNYSSEWIKDVDNHFGKDFIKNNKEAVINSSLAISNADYHHYEDGLKNMIYSETMLYGSYKKYFGLFLDFFNEELNDTERKGLKGHKDAADAFLELIHSNSLVNSQATTVLSERIAENKAKRLNEELLSFLKKHPISNCYNVSKAVKDIIKATEK